MALFGDTLVRKDRIRSRRGVGHNLFTNLIEVWPLSEQADKRLGVFSGLTLTDNNTVTGADGVGSLASQFTAANSEYLSRASEAALQTGDIDFTLAVWVYMDTKSGSMAVLGKNNITDGGREYNIVYNVTADRFRFSVTSDGNFSSQVTVDDSTLGSPSTGTWYHIVAWHDSVGNSINITTNGGAGATQAHSLGVFASSTEFRIGAFADAGNSNAWNGGMQRVAFWKRVLTADERSFLYNSGRGRPFPFVAY